MGGAELLPACLVSPLTSEPLRSCVPQSSIFKHVLSLPSISKQQGNGGLLDRLCHVSEEDMALGPSQDSRESVHTDVWPVLWQAHCVPL